MNRRELVLDVLDKDKKPQYVPAGFFIHFDPSCHKGQAAIDKHLEYFHYTGMDFVKIQYEAGFPQRPEIKKPDDWSQMPLHGKEFYGDQLDVVAGLLKAIKKEALVIVTLYSPFMLARKAVGPELIVEHIDTSPTKVKKGMEIVTESLLLFVRECVALGVDGFYASTQGGETNRFDTAAAFDECVKPYDLAVMNQIDEACIFNIFHVCDYHGSYDGLGPFLEYPGHVVNCSLKIGSQQMSPREASALFNRPYMGGIDRLGIIASGSQVEIREEVRNLLATAGDRYFLGADCTLPSNVNWENVRTAITAAHEFERN